jgi:hypothetical protein
MSRRQNKQKKFFSWAVDKKAKQPFIISQTESGETYFKICKCDVDSHKVISIDSPLMRASRWMKTIQSPTTSLQGTKLSNSIAAKCVFMLRK